jgi:hypothetical protein
VQEFRVEQEHAGGANEDMVVVAAFVLEVVLAVPLLAAEMV